ncbi:MAG: hypothetical protein IPN46_09395 [Saprospiraceae bacterium]|nr:hypothetical protein [Saprospiraceae bacterium]
MAMLFSTWKQQLEDEKRVQVIDSTTAYTMTRMMQHVVIYGTAITLKSQYCKHCDFAGKTDNPKSLRRMVYWIQSYPS